MKISASQHFSILAFALLVLPSADALANEPSVIKLDVTKAVALALEKNLAIRAGMISPEIADQAVIQQMAEFDPSIGGSFIRSESTSREPLDPFSGIRPPDSEVVSDVYNVGINGTLPTGMSYDLGVDVINNRGTFNNFENEFSTTTGISLTQPLLRNFGTDVNLVPLRIARIARIQSDWEYRGLLIEVISSVLRSYNDLYFAYEQLNVTRFSEALAAQTLDENTQRAEIGVMSPLDITTARATLAARKETVLVAERAVQERENALKRLITSDVQLLLSTRLEITPPPLGVPGIQSLQEALRIAFEKRPDYQNALLGIDAEKINLVFVKNQVLPRLDLVGSFGVNGISADFPQSFTDSFNGRSRSWRLGANFSMPIGNRGPRAAREAAELSIEQTLINLKDLEQTIMIDLDNTFGQITTTLLRIEATKQATILAAESLAAEEEKLRAGASTTFVVLQLQQELAAAQANQLRALLDYNNSVVDYHQRMGITLEVQRISVDAKPSA